MTHLLNKIVSNQLKPNIPNFAVGDTVIVDTKIREDGKERIQLFEGVVLSRKGGGVGETFIVRKISKGFGVEKTFPLHSPNVGEIKVIKRGKVRRAKLFYLRDRSGKAARIKEIFNKKK